MTDDGLSIFAAPPDGATPTERAQAALALADHLHWDTTNIRVSDLRELLKNQEISQ